MTNRRKLILLPIIVLSLLFGALVLTACSADSLSEQDVIDMGYSVAVEINYNGGTVNKNTSAKIRVEPDSFIPEPGNYGLSAPLYTGHSIKCYRVAEKDEDGNIKYEDGQIVMGRVWDFAKDKVSEDITLCAEWWDNYKVVLHYGDKYSLEKVIDVPRTVDGSPTSVTSSASSVLGYTFLGYYLDADKNTEVKFPRTFEFESGKSTADVYGDSLTGSYRLIRTAADFSGFVFSDTTNIYLLDNIDMNELYADNKTVGFPSSYSGKFIGNGYTISNIKLNAKPDSASDRYFGLFRSLADGAEIRDVTFENVTYTVECTVTVPSYSMGLLTGLVREGATVENVSISGTFGYTIPVRYDPENVTVEKFIGEEATGSKVSGCTAEDISLNHSTAVYTEDGAYAVYVKYSEDKDGNLTLREVYGIATRNNSGKYSEVRNTTVTAEGDGWKITARNGAVYNVKVTLEGGKFSTTVVVTQQAKATN